MLISRAASGVRRDGRVFRRLAGVFELSAEVGGDRAGAPEGILAERRFAAGDGGDSFDAYAQFGRSRASA